MTSSNAHAGSAHRRKASESIVRPFQAATNDPQRKQSSVVEHKHSTASRPVAGTQGAVAEKGTVSQLPTHTASSSTPLRRSSAHHAALPQLPNTARATNLARPKLFQSNDAENQWLGWSRTPDSISAKPKSSNRRKSRAKRPQWQDVSIDLSALQAAQAEDPESHLQHADKAQDAPNAAHMSGVSPASPSPPKRQILHSPAHDYMQSSSPHALTALSSSYEAPDAPQALSAWRENVGQYNLWQHHQHRLSQDVSQNAACQSSAAVLHDRLQHAQPTRCLPPLHHQSNNSKMSLADPDQHRRSAQAAVTGAEPQQGSQEDPRNAQQVPMQYMRHPYGSGSPGGLHRLHRLLKPITQNRPP